MLITNEPAAGTTLVSLAVVSLVRMTACTMDVAATKLFVTVTVVPAAAMLTVPVGLLMVWLPVVPTVVLVAFNTSPPPEVIRTLSAAAAPAAMVEITMSEASAAAVLFVFARLIDARITLLVPLAAVMIRPFVGSKPMAIEPAVEIELPKSKMAWKEAFDPALVVL